MGENSPDPLLRLFFSTRTFAVFHPGNYRSWIYLYADGICIRNPGRCRFSVFLPVGNLVLKQRPYKTARLFVFWMALLPGSSAQFYGPDDSARPTRPLFCRHRTFFG